MDQMQIDELRSIVAANLKARRLELGLSQTALARAAGLTQASLSLIECGRHSPTLESLAALAVHLHTTPAALLTPDVFSAVLA
jgi:transcriptional regulator with XRE-family HTH domain